VTVVSNVHCFLPGWADANYSVGDRRSNAGNVYQCTVAGASHTPPTGTGSDIVTNTAHWKFLSTADFTSLDVSALQSWADSLPATLTQPMVAELWGATVPAVLATAGSAVLTLAGHTTTTTNTITVRPATGEGFLTKFAAAPTTPFTYNRANGVAIEMPASGFGGVNYVQVDDANVIFDGLQFADLNAASGATIIGGAGSCILQNCIVQGATQTGGAEIIALSGDGVVLRNCLIIDKDTSTTDPTVFATGTGTVVVNCTFISTSALAGKVALSAGGNDTTGEGLVRNSVFVHYPFCYAATSGNGQWAVDHCAHTAAAFDISWCGTDGGGNLFSIVTTDVFLNVSNDYHLKAGSVCINAGVTDATNVPTSKDIFGTSRPQGVAWDVGAHEVVSGSSVSRDFIVYADFRAPRSRDAVTELAFTQSVNVDSGDLPVSWTSAAGGAGGSVIVDVTLEMETLATLPYVPTPLNPFTDDFTSDFGDPGGTLGALSLDPIFPIEWAATVNNMTVDSRNPLEWRATIRRDWTAPADFGVGTMKDAPLPVANLAQPTKDATLSTDWRTPVARDATLPIEQGTAVVLHQDHLLPLEWLLERGTAASAPLPIDHSAPVRRDSLLWADWRIEAVTVTAAFALDYINTTHASLSIPPEWLATQKRDAALPGEYMGTRARDAVLHLEPGARALNEWALPLEPGASGHAGAGTPMPIERSAQPQVNHPLGAAWRATLLRDHEVTTAWTLGARADMQLSASWRGAVRADNRLPLDWTQDTRPESASAVMHFELLATRVTVIELSADVKLGRAAVGSSTTPDEWEAERD
jgi:hypothetical protein